VPTADADIADWRVVIEDRRIEDCRVTIVIGGFRESSLANLQSKMAVAAARVCRVQHLRVCAAAAGA
jgi:hypothetical protein